LGRHIAELSFTYLHWRIIEDLSMDKIGWDAIDDEQLKNIALVILPGGTTVFHYLYDKMEVIEKIFSSPLKDERDVFSEKQYEIPFLPNCKNHSPINICVERQDFRCVNLMLEFLSGYSYDHHSRCIVDSFPIFIEHNLPAFEEYVNSRLQKKVVRKGIIN
jgi:hypothetical protein